MELLIGLLVGCTLAIIPAWLIVRRERAVATAALREENVAAQADLRNAEQRITQLTQEIQTINIGKEQLQQQITELTADLKAAQTANDLHQQHIAEETSARLQREEQEKIARERYAQQQLNLMREQFENASQRLLKERQNDLEKNNQERVGQLVAPLKQELERMTHLLTMTKEGSDKNVASLEGALKAMLAQSERLSKDANQLTDALKNRGKVHGDWGEQVLSDILQGSGLREGEEYCVQESVKGEQGSELRPDVIVNCPDGSRIIVDSKVSLTAYTDYVGAEDDVARNDAIKRNYESVHKHVQELAAKQYPKYVEGAIKYVLMFIPNEGSYVLAMNYKRDLGQMAFRQGVIIVNPTNLMLTLHLVLSTWQNTRQEDNCRKILDAANGLYDKVITVVDTCNRLGNQLDTVNKTYEQAMNQLSEGTGNLLRRTESLKELGVGSTKRLKTKRTKTREINTNLEVQDD
ncbi:MAG: DNA recombination protein RmuC [Paludibacteraceae bacterium]